MAEARKTLYLIDGSSNIYRAYFAIRGLTNRSGVSTNAVFGFVNMLRKLLADHRPDYIGVAFDVSAKTFRHESFPAYKANRPAMPDDLAAQLPYIRAACEGMRIPILELENYEADDVIATLARRGRDAGCDVVVVTQDKDLMQLVGAGIRVFHSSRERFYGDAEVLEEFGVPPDRIPDLMGLWGDAVDNIPGVPGIGEKGAKSLMAEFGSLDALLERTGEIKKKAQRLAIESNCDLARLSRQIATVKDDLPIPLDLGALASEPPDRVRLHSLFTELDFHTLTKEFAPAPERLEVATRVAGSIAEATAALEAAAGGGRMALFVAGDHANWQAARPACLAFATDPGHVDLAVLGDAPEDVTALGDLLSPFLADPRAEIVGHNLKQDLLLLRKLGGKLTTSPRARLTDTMLMSYLLNPGSHNHALTDVALEHLQHQALAREALPDKGEGGSWDPHQPGTRDFLAERPALALLAAPILRAKLEASGQTRVYDDIEAPLIPVLAAMESRGVLLDARQLEAMSSAMGVELERLEGEIYAAAGEPFNIASPPQLGVVLFEKLGLPAGKKTAKTKNYSTGFEVLQELAEAGHAVPRLVLEYRELAKLKSTYADSLPTYADASGRVHTSYEQTGAATGRLSSVNPNLQNIPVRTETGRAIRAAFVAPPGMKLIAADYSQIELRLLAHFSEDPGLIEAFLCDQDIHRATAARVFGVSADLVSGEMRRAAKTINFATLYGQGAFSLSRELRISSAEAKDFIAQYFARYPRVRDYLDATLAAARQHGQTTTLSGRIRPIPEIHNKNWNVRGNAERMATNAPLQGSAADLIKIAMIRVAARLAERTDAYLILQVHDELVLEAGESVAAEIAELVRETMEAVYPLRVPLRVEIGMGRNWLETKA